MYFEHDDSPMRAAAACMQRTIDSEEYQETYRAVVIEAVGKVMGSDLSADAGTATERLKRLGGFSALISKLIDLRASDAVEGGGYSYSVRNALNFKLPELRVEVQSTVANLIRDAE